jgi:TonB family protein
LRAADAPAGTKNGYTVTVEIKIDEKGQNQTVTVVDSDDATAGRILDKMALVMAMRTQLPPHMKDGKPVKATIRAPFFFPIESDEGKAAEALPVPHPKKESAVMPAYPTAFRDQGIVGGAILELRVNAEGKLTSVTTLRASHPEFETAAQDAIRKWQFAPAKQNGQAVDSRTRIAVVFETGDKMADLKWRVAPRPSLGSFVVIRPNSPITENGEDVTPAAAPAAGQPAAAAPAAAPAK